MKSSIPVPAIVAVVVVVLLVVAFFGWRTLNTEPTKTGVGTTGVKVTASPPPSVPGGPSTSPTVAAPGQPIAPSN
jgi:hypothetical protein